MKEIFLGTWPWYVSGSLIGLMVPILLILGGKQFGISASLRHACAYVIPGKVKLFQYSIKPHMWNIVFVTGLVLGGIFSNMLNLVPENIAISANTISDLKELGITGFSGLVPSDIFSFEQLLSVRGFFMIIGGGFLVGFGTSYGNGCTSGHAIMGLSLFSPASLIAVIGFFVGGLISTFLLLPIIF